MADNSTPVNPFGQSDQTAGQAQSQPTAVIDVTPVDASQQGAGRTGATAPVPPPPYGQQPNQKKQKSGKGPAFAAGIIGVILGLAVGGGVTYYAASSAFSSTASTTTSAASTAATDSSSSSGSSSVTIQTSDTSVSTAEAVAQKSLSSVVSVYNYETTTSSGYSFFGSSSGSSSSSSSEELYATGSGVIVSSDGYVVTNAHVVSGASRVTVVIDSQEYDATVVGSDDSSDIAVLKVDKTGLTAINIADSDAVQVGEWCMTIGSPYGLDQSVADGIVSARFRSTALSSTSGVAIYANLIQTNAPINSGSSGGALVNEKGELIGITTLTTSSGSGIGFAIPSNYAMSIANQLIESGVAYHPYLGISMASVTSSLASQYNLSSTSGVYISSVTSGLAAANAGLKQGDVITKVDNTDITTAASLIMTIRSYNIGDTVTITYVRDGKTQTTQCTLSSDKGQSSAGTSTSTNGSTGSGSSGSTGNGDSGYGGGYGGGTGSGSGSSY